MESLWFRSILLASGWAEQVRLTLAEGRIAAIEVGSAPAPPDEAHELGLPGLPNVHSHAFQRAMAGLTESAGPHADHFWSWRELMYRFVERLEPPDVEAITAFAYAEMLEAGFTHVAEFHYLHHDPRGEPYVDPGELAQRIAAAAADTGIGLTLLPVLYAHGNFGGAPPKPAQRRFLNTPERYARLLESSRRAVQGLAGARVGVAPHSLRAVTPDELDAAIALAGVGPVHIHIAEQRQEVADCLAWSGRRPVEWLADHVALDGRWCLVHATHLSAEELALLAASAAVVGLCPITEANLGDGVFPAREYLAAGGRFGIGTDSNVLIDAAAELRLLEYGQRLVSERRNVLTQALHGAATQVSSGRALLEAALRGGTQAVGASGGALEVGASADLLSLDLRHDGLADRAADRALDSLVFAARTPAIDCVWRAGRKVVAQGVHTARAALAARYRRTLERLLR
jgi:formimidoylglutamate deiminase